MTLITALGSGMVAAGVLLLTTGQVGPIGLDAGTSLVGAGVALPFSAWLLRRAEQRWRHRRRRRSQARSGRHVGLVR